MEAISSLEAFEHKDLTKEIAMVAADLSLEFKLAMADSVMLAHARVLNDILVTLDNDFVDIPGVKVVRRG